MIHDPALRDAIARFIDEKKDLKAERAAEILNTLCQLAGGTINLTEGRQKQWFTCRATASFSGRDSRYIGSRMTSRDKKGARLLAKRSVVLLIMHDYEYEEAK